MQGERTRPPGMKGWRRSFKLSYCRFLKTFRFAISRGAGLHFGERGRLPLAQAPAAPRAHESCAVRRQKRARHIKVRPPGTLRPCGAVRAAVCACWARATCLRRGMPARAAPRARRAHAGGLSPRRCCAKHVESGPPGGLAASWCVLCTDRVPKPACMARDPDVGFRLHLAGSGAQSQNHKQRFKERADGKATEHQ